jgi:hypothetical protein
MRYIMFIKMDGGDESFEPTADDVAAMSHDNEELTKAGVLLAMDGLQPPSAGARIEFTAGGRPSVVDGPSAEDEEVVGGYWIIDVKSREDAIEWATRVPATEGTAIELRRISELSDFPQDVQDAAQLSELPPEQTSSSN